VRRAFAVLATAALFVVVWASTAVAQTDYPPTPTTVPGGGGGAGGGGVETVVQPSGAGAATGRLPRTGASSTPSLLLIGVAALVVGLVLVLAVRRHRAAARGSL
jgi:LPXTG-motif cell wall-anchored protein